MKLGYPLTYVFLMLMHSMRPLWFFLQIKENKNEDTIRKL